MPFRSRRQARFMFAKHPKIAKRWVKEGGGKVKIAKGGKGKKKEK